MIIITLILFNVIINFIIVKIVINNSFSNFTLEVMEEFWELIFFLLPLFLS